MIRNQMLQHQPQHRALSQAHTRLLPRPGGQVGGELVAVWDLEAPRVQHGACDNPLRDNSALSPKPLHLIIKR
jgi:hypothetical protein